MPGNGASNPEALHDQSYQASASVARHGFHRKEMPMSAIVRSVRSVEPVDLLKEAVAAAKAKGLRVRVGSCGVMPIGTHGPERWGIDELERDGGVDPLGALLLMVQPPSVDGEEAAALALGVDRCWIDAFADGIALSPKDSRWLASAARRNYMHGYESGANFRIWLKSFPEARA